MESRVEILIKSVENSLTVEKPLDVKTDKFGFGLQYSIDDIRTPDKGNSAYSKTITLPGTDNNNKLLGLLYDVNVDFTYYNPNIKVEARIVINGTTVLDGFMQLKKIRKLNGNDLQGSNIEYNVTVFSEAVDFFTALGEAELTDLDLSDLTHTYDAAGITGSWDNTWSDGYVYPMTDNGDTQYSTLDFKPAFFHKELLLRCADAANFAIGGSFLDNEIYEKEIIPYNGDKAKVNEAEAITREFRAGWTASSTIIASDSNQASVGNMTIAGGYVEILGGPKKFKIPDVQPLPFYDNSGGYNGGSTQSGSWNGQSVAGNSWIANETGIYNFKGQMKFKLEVTNTVASPLYLHTWTTTAASLQAPTYDTHSHRVVISIYKNHPGSAATPLAISIGGWRNLEWYLGPNGQYTVDHPIEFDFPEVSCNQGDLIMIRVNMESYEDPGRKIFYSTDQTDDWFPAIAGIVAPRFILRLDSPYEGSVDSWYKNETVRVGGVLDGQILDPTDYLPKKFKQKDLFVDLIRRYNLYMYPDPANSRKILLETRDDYYSETTIRDWTDKKDYSSEDNIEFLTELHQKEMLFTYKNDTSAVDNGVKYNDVYFKSTSDIYGQKKIAFTNEFVKGEKKIESPFSPTPSEYKWSNGVVVPTIDSRAPKCKPRVLYYGGLKASVDTNLEPSNWSMDYVDSNGDDQRVTYATYPYAGHFDDPITPTIDINFGETSYSFNDLMTVSTDNNLYTRYWANYINQIATGRLITSKFDLNEVDISEIKDNLNYKIFIKDSYYYINKIVDYNPVTKSLTKVELLKIIDGVPYGKKTSGWVILVGSGDLGEWKGDDRPNGQGWVIASDDNGSNVKGRPNSSIVAGEYNRIGRETSKSMIVGSGSTVTGSRNSLILGSDNARIEGAVGGIIISADNKTVTQDGEIWLGELHIKGGVIQNSSNLIDGGFDELSYSFSSNIENLVDGGEDTLRDSFSKNISNKIDGGGISDDDLS